MGALSKALESRKRKGIVPLRGIILSGNYISLKVASDLGRALSPDFYHQSNGEDSAMVKSDEANTKYYHEEFGLQVLHLGLALRESKAIGQLLHGLGPSCPVKELSLTSNNIGPEGVECIVEFLEGK